MTSKTKALKKGTHTPGTATPAPVKKAEKATNVASNNHYARDARKEAEMRSRARRIRSLMKLKIPKEEIDALFEEEKTRTVLCLYYTSFTIEDGVKKKRIYHRDEHHKVTSCEEVEIPAILRGKEAVKEALKRANIEPLFLGPNYCWIKTTKDDLDAILKVLEPIGRTSVTKPKRLTAEDVAAKKKAERKAKEKANRKPSNNTAEAKKAAKAKRKDAKRNAAEMRPYYAALRKGGVSKRIKMHNKNLADKIEAWLKERRKAEAEKAEKDKERRSEHRQLTYIEMKANKRARKAAKHLAAQERRREREKKRMDNNATAKAKRAQKPSKPVQTKIKMAA